VKSQKQPFSETKRWLSGRGRVQEVRWLELEFVRAAVVKQWSAFRRDRLECGPNPNKHIPRPTCEMRYVSLRGLLGAVLKRKRGVYGCGLIENEIEDPHDNRRSPNLRAILGPEMKVGETFFAAKRIAVVLY